jgi:hypothetical protein
MTDTQASVDGPVARRERNRDAVLNWVGDDVVFNGGRLLDTYRDPLQVVGQSMFLREVLVGSGSVRLAMVIAVTRESGRHLGHRSDWYRFTTA